MLASALRRLPHLRAAYLRAAAPRAQGRFTSMRCFSCCDPPEKHSGDFSFTSDIKPRIGREDTRGLIDDELYDEKNLTKMFEANRKWAEETRENNPEFFEYLASGHRPEYLWIGCSDARVPANTITGMNAGSMFVHRNIANLVVNNDMNLMSIIQVCPTNMLCREIHDPAVPCPVRC